MPDIDIDFSVKGRARVMRYVEEKYGKESVAQIVTFGKMLPRNATRDAARVLGLDYGAGDRLAKLIPEPIMGRSRVVRAVPRGGARAAPRLRLRARGAPDHRHRPRARGHRAQRRHPRRGRRDRRPAAHRHRAGAADGGPRRGRQAGERAYKVVTQYSMKPIEEIGLLKMDFLGLRNLDVIEDCLAIIEESTGRRPDMATLPLDDPTTYEMMARGDSIGVFQFESDGMREALRKVKPTEFEDLVALDGPVPPGRDAPHRHLRAQQAQPGRGHLPRRAPAPDHRGHLLGDPLPGAVDADRQGGGRLLGAEADDLRKAIGKKNREAMAALRERFFEGARASGTRENVIQELWAVNEAAADYSFNRSHAACYALIAYRTAWLKANYPAEYMAALISSVMSTKDKVPFFVAQCEDMGIEVLPPDVNESGHDFKVVEGNIRFGLDAVKGLGYQAVEAIIRAREEDGPFTSVWDFCRRVDCQAVNKKASESLVKCGAIDSLPGYRTGMMRMLPNAQAAGAQMQQDAQRGQGSFFDLDDGPGAVSAARPAGPRAARRARAAERVGEGDARAVPLEPPAQGGAAGAASAGRLLAGRPGGEEGRRVGHRRRDDRRVQADPHQEGRSDDVRHARRPRGAGRDARLQLGLCGERRQGRRRPDRDRARPRRPQGGGGDQADRPGGRALRALTRGGAAGGRGGGGRAGVRASPCTCPGRARQLPRGALKEVVGHHRGDHEILLAVGERRLLLGTDCASPRRAPAAPSCRGSPAQRG